MSGSYSDSHSKADDSKVLVPIPSGPPGYPLIGNYFDLKGGMHIAGPKLVAEYGGFFTIRAPSAFFNQPMNMMPGPETILADPDLLEEMYNRHEDFQKRLFKHSQMRKLLAGDGLFTSDDDEPIHDQAARVLLPAFSFSGMKEYFNIISENTQILMSSFDEHSSSGKLVDLHPLLSKFTFEVIAQVGFGKRFNAMTEPCEFLDAFDELSDVNAQVKSSMFKASKMISAVVSGNLRKGMQLMSKMETQIGEIIDEKKTIIESKCPVSGSAGKGCPVKDMAERMLTTPDPKSGERLPARNIVNQAATFLVAGHDSTSTAITMLLFQLAQHPEVEERVYQEVMSLVGDGPITWEALGKMNYCTQVLKENLRMYAPASQFVKVSPPDHATQLGPYEIPPGTKFVISTWGLHYNPRVYPDPEKFDPDRWSPENAAKRSPYAWLPFSYGKRACIGMQLSLIEQRLVLAELVRKFHIRADLSTNLVTTVPLFLNPQGIFLKVSPRTVMPPQTVKLPLSTSSGSSPIKIRNFEELKGRSLVVLFGSNMGTCEDFADRMLRHGEDMGMQCTKQPLDAVCDDSFKLPNGEDGLVLVITSTYNGQPPDNARNFDAWLHADKASKFKDVRFAVFGCGNRQWAATYQKFPNKVSDSLEGLGASCLTPVTEGDMDSGEVELAFARWMITVTVALLRSHRIAVPESIIDSLHSRLPEYDAFLWMGKGIKDLTLDEPKMVNKHRDDFLKANNAWWSTVVSNQELLTLEGRSTRHIEISLPEGMQYTAGDHLGVVGANPMEVVLAYLDHLKIAHDAVVRIEAAEPDQTSHIPIGQPFPAFALLAWYVELQGLVSRVQLRALSKFAQDKLEQQHLIKLSEWNDIDEDNKNLYEETIKKRRCTVLEILQEYSSVQIPLGPLLGLLPQNKPRYYSISSSPKVSPTAVTLTVSVVAGISPTGRKHLGLCSNYLKRMPHNPLPESIYPGRNTRNPIVFVKDTGSSFRLPSSPKVPIIMVGPGTGLAPMRGFLQDRVADGARENVLFFGCRDEHDFLYREELEAWCKDGLLELHVAFSRMPCKPKVYVQQLIQENGSKMANLVKRGAHIYVCGDASKMAPEVKSVFGQVFAANGLSETLVEDMGAEGRYCEDVWAAQSI